MKRIHNVIILTSGAIATQGAGVIDHAIRRVLKLQKNPILVLGSDGDDVLRCCTEIEPCDLVFDEDPQGREFSAIQSGLHATIGAAFILPLKHGLPDERVWAAIESSLSSSGEDPVDLVRPVTHDQGTPLFPFAVTARGVKRVIELETDSDWTSLIQISNLAVAPHQQDAPGISEATS